MCSSLEQLLCSLSISFGLFGADCASPLSVVSHIYMPTKRSWPDFFLGCSLNADWKSTSSLITTSVTLSKVLSRSLHLNITGTSNQYILRNHIKSVKICLIPVETGFIIPKQKKRTFRRGFQKLSKELKGHRVPRDVEIQVASILPATFLGHKFGFSKTCKEGGTVVMRSACTQCLGTAGSSTREVPP
jgi:hypothetical protein